MESVRFYVVAMQIADARRRARIRQLLRTFGQPINRDTFELALSERAMLALKTALALELAADDVLRAYPVCERCRRHVSLYGEGELAAPPTAYIF
jgi:CRISPR-associated endonuclease Cas2